MKILFSLIIFFIAVLQSNAQINFQDKALELGVEHLYGGGTAGGGVSFADFNGDGLDDITLATEEGRPLEFYKNTGSGFVKLPALIVDTFETKQIIWVDYDNDHDKDLYITTYNGPNRLFQNDGNLVLTDVTQAAGLPTDDIDSFGACWGDIDRDGFLDLYFTKRAITFSTNEAWLYKNLGDGTFENITATAGVADLSKAAFQSVFLDINHDMWQDIYTAHDKTKINTLFKNKGDLTFEDISSSSNANVEINAMGIAVGDYDNDGDLDMYVSNTPDGNKLLNNNGFEYFIELASFTGVSFNGIGWGSNFLDADNDGDLDLYVSGSSVSQNITSSEFYQNIGFGQFENSYTGFEGDTVASIGNAIGDFNEDGFPDIFVNNRDSFPSQFWQNFTASNSQNNYLKVKLTGVISNADGIGSWITIFLNGQRQVRYTHCGMSFLSQNSETEIFGLGVASQVDSIHVEWLTGHVDKLYDVAVNQKIMIEEGSTTNGEIFIDSVLIESPPVSISKLEKSEHKIHIFPNPTNGNLNITAEQNGINLIQVFDQNGMEVWNKTFDISTKSFSENIPLPQGFYWVKTTNELGVIQYSKLIFF